MNYKMIAMKISMPLLLAGLMTASVYACEIQYTQKPVALTVGQVMAFGDLKVKLVSREGSAPTFKIKSPDFEKDNVIVRQDTPVVIRVCGHDVSVVFIDWGVSNGVALGIVNSDM